MIKNVYYRSFAETGTTTRIDQHYRPNGKVVRYRLVQMDLDSMNLIEQKIFAPEDLDKALEYAALIEAFNTEEV